LKITACDFIKHLVCILQLNFEHEQFNQIFNATNNQQLKAIKEIKRTQKICLGSSRISHACLFGTSPPNLENQNWECYFKNDLKSLYKVRRYNYNQIEKLSNLDECLLRLELWSSIKDQTQASSLGSTIPCCEY
jgi:hypothetical protein